ncbi:retrovirus-related pol polyprotein from transposon TNT 1-94 [Tanacetum coccineum]|uniref:Retrovirus-related pol polyprotein from transposon TNT 1-94 n=1 Tax=Tanacetum coccineum TaxID=301880 RepID=A0ABQ5A7T5_9ASTR
MSTQATHNPQQIVNMHNNFMQLVEKIVPTMLGTRKIFTMESRFLRSTTYISRHNIEMTPENKENFQSEKEANFLLFQPGDIVERTRCKDQSFLRNLGSLTDPRWRIHGSLLLTVLQLMNVLTRNYLQLQQCNVNVQFSSTTSTRMFQLEVNEIRAERISQKCKSVSTSLSLQFLNEDSDTEQAGRDKDMKKNWHSLTKVLQKKLYKPTTTTSNFLKLRKKTKMILHQGYNNDIQSGQFGNQRTMGQLLGAREKQYGRKPAVVKDYAYHKEKMMMCKQAEQGVPLQAEQADWLEDTDEEIDEQELEAHYSYMAKIQEVSPEESSSTGQPLEQVQNHDESNVYDNVRRHSEQPESINDTYVLEKDDSNVTSDSSNICTNDNQADQNAVECVNERDALANLIANLTLDTEENKTILKQLKKANASLTQELEKCKTNLDETNSALGEAISCRDSCLIALQNKQNEFEKYKAFNDRTIDYEILQTKLNETLGLIALKDIEIKEGLKTKAYEISVLDQKHDDLVKKSLLTKSQLEGYLKENTKVISDLKVKEEKDIDKMIEMDKQLKFLNEIVYTRNQSIQTIHMLAPKCATYNGRLTFANPRYLKKAQSDKPCLYEIPYDTSDPANRFAPDREETMTLDNGKLYEKQPVCKENASNVISNELVEQYHEIQDLKAQMQDKNMVINELKKLILVTKGKYVETQFDKPSVVRQPNAQRIPKPSVLGKPTPFSNSPEMRITQQNLPQNRNQAVRNTNVLKPGMYRIASTTTQTRTPQLPHASRNTNPHMSKSSGVIHTTSVSRPQLKCYQVKDKSVTACNDSSNSRTSNVNAVCAECGKCVFNSNHDACVSRFLNDVNTRTKKPNVVPISASKPKRKANKSVATPHKKTIVQLILFIVDSGCTKHMMGNLKLLCNFVEKFLGTVHFGNDQFAPIQNRTLVEAARTMLSASKLPLSFWAEAVATACYTQNRSIIISTHGKTAYHIINDRKPSIKHLHIFGCICYITRDGENLDKMKEKGDPCVMVGYSTQSKGYRVYNKRTRLIVESIHIKFDEIKEMMSDHNSSDLAPQRQEMSVENVSSGLVPQGQKASDYDNSDPVPPRQNVVPTAEKTDSSQQGLEFLFSPLLEEYYNPTHGQAEENNNNQAPNASFQEDEFINPFCTRV